MKFDVPTEDEYALVFDSWSRSFKKSPWAGCVTNDMYDQVSRRTIADILDRGATVRVACAELPTGGRRVMGYVVCEPEKRILHWLFVKRDFRGMGVGSSLLREVVKDDETWTYTHRTRASVKFLGPQFEWDPVPARVRAA